METMLDRIEIMEETSPSRTPECYTNALRDTQNELEFKVRIGKSAVWDNCMRLEKFLGSAVA